MAPVKRLTMNPMKKPITMKHLITTLTLMATSFSTFAKSNDEWDKTFPKSEKVEHQKVTFKNRYGITLAADLYQPKDRAGNAGGARGQWSVWRGEGAVFWPVCANHGRTRIRHAGFRPFLHRRKRWRAASCRLAGHQYRGFQRGGGFPRPASFR